jgi:hypothetical protein
VTPENSGKWDTVECMHPIPRVYEVGF